MLVQVQLFCRGGHVGVALLPVFLLAGGQRAGNAGIQQQLLCLQRQQPQRRQIYAGARGLQRLKAGIGLAGVGAADVQDKVPLHGPCLGIFVLGVERHQQL